MAAQDNALARAYGKMAGGAVPSAGDTDERVLRGFGVSSGKAKGPVKVVTNVEEAAEQLYPGDVLVTEMITSFWIPLFPRIAGMITMRGGMLSHGAVVAREHGLPAISGVEGVTSVLQDGQWVELDADAGEIRICDKGE
uniref:PPDK gamma subunit n=1 Tax=uncultured bacterial symbiont of Discodermia dissoluta TaxID=323654 RepID=Q49HJ1_9BACT|nr:PPDK gamma subunit [uncultured bacterial symbiont of Discodermia dissoluta]